MSSDNFGHNLFIDLNGIIDLNKDRDQIYDH